MPEIQKYKTRQDLLSLVPKGAKIVEIGVFKGEFAKIIYDTVSFDEFYMVDIWTGTFGSGDKDGNNHVIVPDMEAVYKDLLQQTKHITGIHVVRSTSESFLKGCANNYFDAIYVDGDHTGTAVYNDLVESYRTLKPGGLLMGHDYHYEACRDIVLAVARFCEEYGQSICGLTEDGCPSFLIRVTK